MRNKILMTVLLFSIFSLSCATFNKLPAPDMTKASVHKRTIESIPFGVSPEEVIKSMGPPFQKAYDEKSRTQAFRYVENQKGTMLSRENFVFGDAGVGMKLKYFDLYENDPEYSLDFWRLKYPGTDLIIKTNRVMSKDSISDNQYIELSANQTLEIKNNHVVTIYWKK